jgi:hypothetical protein
VAIAKYRTVHACGILLTINLPVAERIAGARPRTQGPDARSRPPSATNTVVWGKPQANRVRRFAVIFISRNYAGGKMREYGVKQHFVLPLSRSQIWPYLLYFFKKKVYFLGDGIDFYLNVIWHEDILRRRR